MVRTNKTNQSLSLIQENYTQCNLDYMLFLFGENINSSAYNINKRNKLTQSIMKFNLLLFNGFRAV